ncbi:hypothetical protein L227DRAFT_612937 [Lentinus tigrinus ALCF2SS1-6]|uniref:Uncharacterized protein n=1 Tax=Lentinus tigrinus ALCF2SS1-6 TaxID=1328759 RepID=A0A5C2S3T0_9APHY|nr:hypothetical protein L227DRAFT_612937 [Lentinus tigrinus ALCF2SS1-6]
MPVTSWRVGATTFSARRCTERRVVAPPAKAISETESITPARQSIALTRSQPAPISCSETGIWVGDGHSGRRGRVRVQLTCAEDDDEDDEDDVRMDESEKEDEDWGSERSGGPEPAVAHPRSHKYLSASSARQTHHAPLRARPSSRTLDGDLASAVPNPAARTRRVLSPSRSPAGDAPEHAPFAVRYGVHVQTAESISPDPNGGSHRTLDLATSEGSHIHVHASSSSRVPTLGCNRLCVSSRFVRNRSGALLTDELISCLSRDLGPALTGSRHILRRSSPSGLPNNKPVNGNGNGTASPVSLPALHPPAWRPSSASPIPRKRYTVALGTQIMARDRPSSLPLFLACIHVLRAQRPERRRV